MKREIKITKKVARKGEDGHKVVSVRMKDSTIARLDDLSAQTSRSRNELINIHRRRTVVEKLDWQLLEL